MDGTPLARPTPVPHHQMALFGQDMTRNGSSGSRQRSWRVYSVRDGSKIDRAVGSDETPVCPTCGDVLEAQRGSRLSPCLVLDATAYDLACHSCMKLWCVVRHTERSLQLVRMRRLASAVRSVDQVPNRKRMVSAVRAASSQREHAST